MALADQIANLQSAEASERQAISTAATRIDQGFAALQAQITAVGADSPALQTIIDNIQADTVAISSIALQSVPPLPIPPPSTLESIAVSTPTIPSGGTFTGTVTLTQPAPANGIIVTLEASDPSITLNPGSVTIPEGDSSGAFSGTASEPENQITAMLTASYGGVTQNVAVTIRAAAEMILPESITLSPEELVGGGVLSGVIALSDFVVGDTTVELTSSDPSVPVVNVDFLDKTKQASFTVTTLDVSSDTTVTLTATLNGTSVTAEVTVLIPATVPVETPEPFTPDSPAPFETTEPTPGPLPTEQVPVPTTEPNPGTAKVPISKNG